MSRTRNVRRPVLALAGLLGLAALAGQAGVVVLPAAEAVAQTSAVKGSGSSSCGNCAGNGGVGAGNGGGNGTAPKSFTISGQVTGLAPGVTKGLHLAVSNPNSQALRVTGLTAQVTGVSGGIGSCSAGKMTVGAWAGPEFVVAAGALSVRSPGAIPITMLASAEEGCQKAVFSLSYTGTAVQA